MQNSFATVTGLDYARLRPEKNSNHSIKFPSEFTSLNEFTKRSDILLWMEKPD